MSDIVSIKIPVSYEKTTNTDKKHLIYKLIDISKEEEKRYQNYCRLIEGIFDHPKDSKELVVIQKKLNVIINESKSSTFLLEFLTDNQWLLEFARKNDIEQLLNTKGFSVHNCMVDFPVDAYIASDYKKIFEGRVSAPIWEKNKIKFQGQVIRWLFLDEKNTFEDRLNSVLLSSLDYIKNVVIDNIWVMMFLDNERRIKIMETYNIPYKNVVAIIPDSNSYNLFSKEKRIAVPDELCSNYISFYHDIKQVFYLPLKDVQDALLQYCYKHSKLYRSEQEFDPLRQNLWILDFMDSKSKEKTLHLLGILPHKKIMTVMPNNSRNKLYSKQVSVNPKEYENYETMNQQLLAILSNGMDKINEEEVFEFIINNEGALQMWPWLSEYIENPDLKVRIIEKEARKK